MTARPRKRPATPRADGSPRQGASRPALTALLVACLVFVLCAVYAMPFMPDDSFISFRYAEHLAQGHGLAFNVDERPVEAYSNFLWIVLCAGMHKTGLNLPRVTPYAGILLGLLSIVVLWTLCRRRAPLWTQQLLPLLLFASFGPFVLYAVSGMETALFALLLLLVVRYAEDAVQAPARRPLVLLGVVGFLASLARPEGILALPVALILIAVELRRGGRLPAAARSLALVAGAFVIACAAYHAWRVAYFGDWLPTPFLSKGVEGTGLVTGWRMNLSSYFVNWTYYYPPQGWTFLALLVLAVAGNRVARTSGNRIALAMALVFGAVYANFVDWMPGMRYHVAIAGLLLLPAASLHALVPDEWWRFAPSKNVAPFATLVVVALLAGSSGLSHFKMVTQKMEESATLCNRPLAQWLRNTVPPGSLLAIADVGMVPYYSGLRTLDIHPRSLTDSHIAKGAFTVDYVLARKPDVICLSVRGVYTARMDPSYWSLYKHDGFRLEYGFVGTVRDQWYQDRAYWVFLRNGVDVSDDRLRALPEGIGKQRRTRFDP
jgi:arabinofuranosyltransferase